MLEDRGDAKPNPKKKMFEADLEDAKQTEREKREGERGKDEL